MSLYSRLDRAVVQAILGLSGNGLILFGTDRSFVIKFIGIYIAYNLDV